MKKSKVITSKLTEKVAKLSKLPVDKSEESYLTRQFNETLNVVQELDKVNTKGTPITSQVTGLENVTREDEIDKGRVLTQEEALSGAKRKYGGFFVVEAIFNEE